MVILLASFSPRSLLPSARQTVSQSVGRSGEGEEGERGERGVKTNCSFRARRWRPLDSPGERRAGRNSGFEGGREGMLNRKEKNNL